MIDIVRATIREVTGEPMMLIRSADTLASLGLDSLDRTELWFQLEQKTRVRLSESMIVDNKKTTVADVAMKLIRNGTPG